MQGTLEQVLMDLPDFVPQEYVIRFRICGRPYEVRYQEARVDEVLALLQDAEDVKPLDQQVKSRRAYVTDLFCRNLVVGDQNQLAEDLKLVPYVSLRGGLDIFQMYQEAQGRVKKKPTPNREETVAPSGLRGRLRSWLRRVRGD